MRTFFDYLHATLSSSNSPDIDATLSVSSITASITTSSFLRLLLLVPIRVLLFLIELMFFRRRAHCSARTSTIDSFCYRGFRRNTIITINYFLHNDIFSPSSFIIGTATCTSFCTRITCCSRRTCSGDRTDSFCFRGFSKRREEMHRWQEIHFIFYLPIIFLICWDI